MRRTPPHPLEEGPATLTLSQRILDSLGARAASAEQGQTGRVVRCPSITMLLYIQLCCQGVTDVDVEFAAIDTLNLFGR